MEMNFWIRGGGGGACERKGEEIKLLVPKRGISSRHSFYNISSTSTPNKNSLLGKKTLTLTFTIICIIFAWSGQVWFN